MRISDNGEFIHQNQGTVDDQGVVNVSHGCINLSAESAEAYFESAIYGDPVEVTGTSVPLSAADGDIYDWATPGTEWLTMCPALTGLRGRNGIRPAPWRAVRLFHAAAVAQSAERLTRNEKVWGSIPHSGSSRRGSSRREAPYRTSVRGYPMIAAACPP